MQLDIRAIKEVAANLHASTGAKATYVCTICGKVQLPTFLRNIRCSRCNAPLSASLESAKVLRTKLKKARTEEEKEAVKELMLTVKSMKQELAGLNKMLKKVSKEEVMQYSMRSKKQNAILRFEVTFKSGKKITVRIKDHEMEAFFKQTKKLKAVNVKFLGEVQDE